MSATWQWAKANPDAAARRIRELERENADLYKAGNRMYYALSALDPKNTWDTDEEPYQALQEWRLLR